jgi:nitrous oxidase accessory protein NosD
MDGVRRTAVSLAATCLAVATLWVPRSVQAASVLHVPGDYSTIQAAIDAAVPGDTVLVAPGTYVERIRIYAKEITVESSGGPDVTTIDGNETGTVAWIYAAPGEAPALRGFTITGGYAFGDPGGVLVAGGPALIEGNRIVDNVGGGVWAEFSEASIHDNTIAMNRTLGSGSFGGGILILGSGTVNVRGNRITDNTADSMGGGIDLYSAGPAVVASNVITGNSAIWGGGIHAGNATDAQIYNNLVAGNSALWGGGIGYEARAGRVTNNTIVGNTGRDGSAIYASILSGALSFTNNIVVGESEFPLVMCGPYGDPLDPPSFANNDFVNRGGARFGGSCTDPTGLDGNLSEEPGIVDEPGGDYHLQPGSPVIDAGRNDGAPTLDFEGDPRPFDGDADGTPVVDIGFDEFVNQSPEGSHDGSTDLVGVNEFCYANGWASDPDDRSADVTVRVLADDAVVWQGPADEFRQDLLDAGIGDGTAGFFVPLDNLVSHNVAHEIRAQAQDLQTGGWADLWGTPRTITCTGLWSYYDGNEGIVAKDACYATGWAYDADTPEGPRVQVRISVDGKVVAETAADLYREDVRDAGFGDGYSGWWVNLYGKATPNRPHVVSVEMRDTTDKKMWVPFKEAEHELTCLTH